MGWENNIKMTITYWQNLAQIRCNAVSCKRGNIYTSYTNIYQLTKLAAYMQ